MTDLEYNQEIIAMMRLLYEEDEAASSVDYSRFPSSIEHFVSHPSSGQIVLFREGSELRGYALLVPYWSRRIAPTHASSRCASSPGHSLRPSFTPFIARKVEYWPIRT